LEGILRDDEAAVDAQKQEPAIRSGKVFKPKWQIKKGGFIRGIQTDTVCCWWMMGGLH